MCAHDLGNVRLLQRSNDDTAFHRRLEFNLAVSNAAAARTHRPNGLVASIDLLSQECAPSEETLHEAFGVALGRDDAHVEAFHRDETPSRSC
jgi:hypothetical protein